MSRNREDAKIDARVFWLLGSVPLILLAEGLWLSKTVVFILLTIVALLVAYLGYVRFKDDGGTTDKDGGDNA